MAHPHLRLDAQLCFPLYAASRAVTRLYGDLLGDLRLTYPQYLVLLALWEREEPMTVGEIGQALKLDSGTLSPVVKRLEAAGLVVRRRDEDDERRVLVTVTEAGRALEERAARIPEGLMGVMDFTPDEAAGLIAQLNKLVASVERAIATRA